MKTIILLGALALTTLLNAATVIEQKYIHVRSSYPIYEQVNTFYDDDFEYEYETCHVQRRHHHKKHRHHYKHIIGYRNIGYYHGVKISKKSHRRLHRIPIEIAISF
jgi:hypothetical protein